MMMKNKMVFKNWPSWLKGGVVGGTIYLIYVMIGFPFSLMYPVIELGLCGWDGSQGIFDCENLILAYKILILLIPFVIFVILASLIGALVGFIIGKIKQANSLRESSGLYKKKSKFFIQSKKSQDLNQNIKNGK